MNPNRSKKVKVKDHQTTNFICRTLIEFLKPTSVSFDVAPALIEKLQTEFISFTSNMVQSISLALPRHAVYTQECCYGFQSCIFATDKGKPYQVQTVKCVHSAEDMQGAVSSHHCGPRGSYCLMYDLSFHCLRTKEQPSLSQYN